MIEDSIGKNSKYYENINISNNNKELEQGDYAKYLGIYIDKNLSWRKQFENITYKLNRGVKIVKKLRQFLKNKSN